MKRTLLPAFGSLCLLALLASSRVLAGTWEWTFDGSGTAAAIGSGTQAWSTPAAASQSSFAVSNGGSVPHIGGKAAGYVSIPAYTNQADFMQLSFHGSAANGGGLYINRYTLVFDVYIPSPVDWVPFFNTNVTNSNDADFYVSPGGTLGVGPLGYSAATVSTNAWHRLVFAADLTEGRVRYFLDGTKVFERVPSGSDLLDQRFSIASDSNPGVDLIVGNEGDSSGVYTHAFLLAGLAFVDRPLSDAEITALGGPQAAGIFVNASVPPRLQMSVPGQGNVQVGWNQIGWTLQRSTTLKAGSWSTLSGSETGTNDQEPRSGGPVFFRLVNP